MTEGTCFTWIDIIDRHFNQPCGLLPAGAVYLVDAACGNRDGAGGGQACVDWDAERLVVAATNAVEAARRAPERAVVRAD